MRVETVREMSRAHDLPLPSALEADWPVTFETRDERGWFRFQSLYDAARACVRGEDDMRRIVREAALGAERTVIAETLRQAIQAGIDASGPTDG